MELFDTHAHYDDRRFSEDSDEVIQNAHNSGVKYIINVGADLPSSRASIRLAEKYDFIYAAVGVHPHDAKTLNEKNFSEIKEMTRHPKVVAIGEIGLDYYYDHSPRETQKIWFERQLELSKELDLPFIIHNRDSHEDVMDILKKHIPYQKPGIFHAFSGSWEMAKELIKMGLFISVGGPITFKNARKAVEVVEQIPLDSLLIETDSPYLTPEPHRGKRNDSSYVRHVAEKIADIKKMNPDKIAEITLKNALNVFQI